MLQLACLNSSDTISALSLHLASIDPRFRLDWAGDNALFLSVDPATVGRAGCRLAATVSTAAAGSSDPYELGRVVRLPRIERFNQKIEPKLYGGTLTGEDLQLIQQTGWTAKHGYPVQGDPHTGLERSRSADARDRPALAAPEPAGPALHLAARRNRGARDQHPLLA